MPKYLILMICAACQVRVKAFPLFTHAHNNQSRKKDRSTWRKEREGGHICVCVCILLDSHVICNDYITPPPKKKAYCPPFLSVLLWRRWRFIFHSQQWAVYVWDVGCVCKQEALFCGIVGARQLRFDCAHNTNGGRYSATFFFPSCVCVCVVFLFIWTETTNGFRFIGALDQQQKESEVDCALSWGQETLSHPAQSTLVSRDENKLSWRVGHSVTRYSLPIKRQTVVSKEIRFPLTS